MKHADIRAMMAEIAPVIREFTETALSPALARIAELEKRQSEKGDRGERGLDGVPGPAGESGPAGQPGERGERGEKGDRGEQGPEGPAGKDAPEATHEQIVEALLSMPAAIDAAVKRYLAENPPPAGRDGINGSDGAPGEKGADGRDGHHGRDGISLAGALIDRGGNLVVTLSDGTARELGPVVGKDGASGPAGRDGADGIGFDDMDLVETEDGVFLRFTRGETVKDFRLPIVVDRGVYREGGYRKGDGVTYGGSFWIAQEDTAEKPDSGKGWRLAVKRGRDGKDGAVKNERPKGPLRIG